jgi:hypothetical protein
MYETSSATPGWIFWAFWLGLYLFFGYTQYRIAQKVGHQSPWYAFIPIVNIFQQVSMAGKPWWWFVLYLIPVVNIVALAVIWIEIAQRCRKSPVWGIFYLLPFLNMVSLAYLAFSSTEAPPPQPVETPERQPEKVV